MYYVHVAYTQHVSMVVETAHTIGSI